jgi:glycerol-3-phosphate O-acyltransferase/dihydroxyacetone phosphate acyltransferase
MMIDEKTCRLLFKFVLKIFYGSIVIENTELIPGPGEPWCVHHTSNRAAE